MNVVVTALGLVLILGNGLVQLQQGVNQTTQAASQQAASQQASPQSPSVQQIPASPIGAPSNGVQITHGPVVENVTDTTVEIAWSTNVNSGTALHYGTDPSHLDQTAGMPWGGFTHRVFIKNLKPNTTYYFKAESGQAQGTGTLAQAAQASFQTKAAGATAEK
ncbi:MAG TPA: fibronectin type III domain-containing protein [Blattabacteriaceae bacterium]|nr:fibronectin type III domain-containing protein [Blattabacteriaceae bacterium]